MTRILKMEMKGFKSFANRTEVLFGDNFNCILGPNGSGKSNVLDALCFVLGKAGAKGLRVEKSSNLIYNGGKSKKPAKEGEVSIWFDNSNKEFEAFDDKEIKLTRLIKGTGQGVYKINDVTKTRTQIIDLLSMANIDPDGYNIILQGDIVRLIEMSTTDRRKIVEEIAGINIYEDKKNKALRELNRVEEKLNQADIVLVEREAYLSELKKDRNQALKFKRLEDNKKRNKKTLLTKQLEKDKTQLKSIEENMSNVKSKISKSNEEIDSLRKSISEKEFKIKELNQEVENKGEKEQVKVHKEVENLKVSVNVAKQRLQTISTELEKLKGRQNDLKSSFEELKSKIDSLEKEKVDLTKRIEIRKNDLDNVQNRISEFKKKNNLDASSKVDERINLIDQETDKIAEEIGSLRENQQNLFRDKDRLDMSLESIDDKLAKVAQIKEENKQDLAKLKQHKVEFKSATSDLSKALSQSSEFALQLSNARNKIISKEEERAKLNARKAAMLEQIAGSSAIQSVLELAKKDSKIYGTIAELGGAKEDYALALEIAAGNRIRSIVVEDDATAAKCIRFVKDKQLGVISVLPLNKLRTVEIDKNLRNMKTPGVHGLALDLLDYDPKFDKAFKHVFGNTLVVDSLDVARKIGIGKARMATLSGDITELSGAMQGGYRAKKKAGGAFSQSQIDKQIKTLDKEISDASSVVSLVEQKARDNEELIQRLRNLKAELEGDIIKMEKLLHLDSDESDISNDTKKKIQSDLKEIDKKIDDVTDKIGDKNKYLAKLKIEKQSLRDQIMELRNPAKLAELQSFEEKKSELQTEIIKLEGDKKHAIAQMESVIGPENRKTLEIMKQHDKEVEEFLKEQNQLRKQITSEEKELQQKEKQESAFYKQFKDLFDKRDKLKSEVSKAENKIINHNADIRVNEQKINAYSIDLARLRAEVAGLEEELKHYPDIEIYTNKSEESMKRELSQFEKMAEEIGAVNMRALEIYDKVEEEYHKLIDKKDTLSKERTEVLAMINQIDGKKKELFLKTFYSLDENFKKFFEKLIVKGDASLVIENEEDPFEAGLEIKVRLTGKRFLDIRSLSGGEKTLAALAFLFAVQEYEPASFYVLDEVDAALDKKNAEKLAKLIRSYCDRAQYVVISHNDGVIAEADKLYGISMNEHGMSKVTTLKL